MSARLEAFSKLSWKLSWLVCGSLWERELKFSAKVPKAPKQLEHTVKRSFIAKLSSAKFLGRPPWLGAMLIFDANARTSALRTSRIWGPSLALATWYKFRLRLDRGSPIPKM